MASALSSSENGDQTLNSAFSTPNRGDGSVTVKIHSDDNPAKYGFDLLFPTIPLSDFRGFPVCEAKVESNNSGYASMYGWTQLVKDSNTDSKTWEFDDLPITKNLNWPFCWFGSHPTLFDGPFRKGISTIDWTCRSFLTYIDSTVLSKNINHVYGFEWGFQITDGIVSLKKLKELEPADWNDHVEYLSATFPGWTFSKVSDH